MGIVLSYIIGIGPYIAFAVGFAMVLAGFTPWAVRNPVRWIFLAVLALTYGAAIGDATAEGSVGRQVSWGVFFLLSAAILFVDGNREGFGFFRNIPVFFNFLILWIVISISWSDAPFVSLKRVIQIIGVLVVCLLMTRNADSKKSILHQIYIPVILFIWVGLLVAIFLPSYAFDADHSFRAIASHKNVWGEFSLLACLVSLFVWFDRKGNVFTLFFALVPAIVSLILSHSATSLTSFMFVTLVLLLSRIFSTKNSSGVTLLIVSFMVLGAMFLVYLVITGDWPQDALSRLFYKTVGKEESLTGRKFLWQLMFSEIDGHPWLGAGYGGFWTNGAGPSAILVSKLNWGPPTQAHNGYIDMLNEVGLIGLGIFCLVVIQHIRSISVVLRRGDRSQGIFHAALICSVLIINYAETCLLRTTHIWWIVICASILEVNRMALSIRQKDLFK